MGEGARGGQTSGDQKYTPKGLVIFFALKETRLQHVTDVPDERRHAGIAAQVAIDFARPPLFTQTFQNVAGDKGTARFRLRSRTEDVTIPALKEE